MLVNDYAELQSNVLLSGFKWHGSIAEFFEVVKSAGYPYFAWNGRIYKVTDGQRGYVDTGNTFEQFE